jgi:hypothetical protein
VEGVVEEADVVEEANVVDRNDPARAGAKEAEHNYLYFCSHCCSEEFRRYSSTKSLKTGEEVF